MPNPQKSMLFSAEHFGHVELKPDAARVMIAACVASGRRETGGILIGHLSDDTKTAIITEATPRPKGSSFGWVWFRRSEIGLAEMLASRWEQGLHYLGEWHFHPGGSPRPSTTDNQSMRSVASRIEYQCKEPILVIVGGNPPVGTTLSVSIHPRGEKSIELAQMVG